MNSSLASGPARDRLCVFPAPSPSGTDARLQLTPPRRPLTQTSLTPPGGGQDKRVMNSSKRDGSPASRDLNLQQARGDRCPPHAPCPRCPAARSSAPPRFASLSASSTGPRARPPQVP